MRLSEGKINSKLSMLAINYLACMIVGVGYMGADHLIPSGEGVVPMLGMGLINGIFYAWGLVMNQKNTSLNGVVLTSVFSKMGGLLIPLAVSIVLFREDPTLVQILGFVISTVAIVMICQRGEESGSGKIYIGALVMLFAADGFDYRLYFCIDRGTLFKSNCRTVVLRYFPAWVFPQGGTASPEHSRSLSTFIFMPLTELLSTLQVPFY